jgi:endonuclease-3 related protein
MRKGLKRFGNCRTTMLKQLYKTLLARHGAQGWWPTRKYGYHALNKSRKLSEQEMLEICIGAILAQNTSWNNVGKALDKLFSAGVMSLEKLAFLRRQKLEQLVRSSGFYRQKAERVQLFAKHVLQNHGCFSSMFKKKLAPLREELLSLNGIGPETADSMLLYAGRKSIFVIDAYTRRWCKKRGICNDKTNYDELQKVFHEQLPRDHRVFNEMHALIVKEGRLCRKVCVHCCLGTLSCQA